MARSNWEPRSQSGAQSVRSLEVTMAAGATVIFDTKNAGWEFGPVGWDITTAAGATLTCFGSNRAVPDNDSWIPCAKPNDTIRPNKSLQDYEVAPVAWLRYVCEGGTAQINISYFGTIQHYLSTVGPTLTITDSSVSIESDATFELDVTHYIDSNQPNLTYQATTSDASVFTATIDSTIVTITPVAAGTANLNITGTNIAGGATTVAIEVIVEA